MRIPFTLLLTTLLLNHNSAIGQNDKNDIQIEQLTGYYEVGVKPNKPLFRSRWYLRDGKLFCIYDSDIDREIQLYENDKLRSNIFFDEADLPEIEDDTTYYLIITMEGGKMKNFKVKRPRSEWPTDLYGYRNDKLSKLAVDTEEDLTLNHVSEHFYIQYSSQDSVLIPGLSQKLEDRYADLLTSFELEYLPITTIRIYPDLETYHNAVLTPGAPNWQMGRAWDNNEIRMLSPITAESVTGETLQLNELVLHEFVHCIHLNMISSTTRVPGWLWEGLAVYKGCCQWIENPKELDYIKKKKYPSLKQINKDRTSQMKYDMGYYLIEFIDKKYGWEEVLKLIDNNGDLSDALGTSSKKFEKKFYGHIENQY